MSKFTACGVLPRNATVAEPTPPEYWEDDGFGLIVHKAEDGEEIDD